MENGGHEGCSKDMRELIKNKTPCLGMEFHAVEVANHFYNEYRRIMRFGIRKDCHSKNRDLSKWIVKKFDDNRNHPLHLPQYTHLIPSQKKLCQAQALDVDIADDTDISLKASHDLISALAGEKKIWDSREMTKKAICVEKDNEISNTGKLEVY
ncbi:hypothetical protein ACSBR2_028349 [Camellia fascicularis]